MMWKKRLQEEPDYRKDLSLKEHMQNRGTDTLSLSLVFQKNQGRNFVC